MFNFCSALLFVTLYNENYNHAAISGLFLLNLSRISNFLKVTTTNTLTLQVASNVILNIVPTLNPLKYNV